MKPKFNQSIRALNALPFLVVFSCFIGHTSAATIKKANNTNALNTTTSWGGGVVPGASDIALWESTVAAANTTTLGADLTWQGIKISTTAAGGGNVGGLVTINGTNTLTLGAAANDIDLGRACPSPR